MSDDIIDIVKSKPLIKATGAIHIHNNISLVQRKISNILLSNAKTDLQSAEKHRIGIKAILDQLGWNSGKAYNQIKNDLRSLNTTQLEWNILGQDKKNKWGISTYLASAEIEDGVCEYSYSPPLKKLLKDSGVYARLDMDIQKNFTSKFSIALWEYLSNALCTNVTDQIQTPWVSITDLKKLLGVETDSDYYSSYKRFNSKILSPALKEINLSSDLKAVMHTKKEGRSIKWIAFLVEKRSEAIQMELSLDTNEVHDVNIETKPSIYYELVNEFGVSKKVAGDLLKNFENNDIVESLLYVREQIKSKNEINNLPGYTVSSIERGYKPKTTTNIECLTDEEIKNENDISVEYWKNVRSVLMERVGIPTFRSWFYELEFSGIEESTALLIAKNKFIKNWIEEKNLLKEIQDACMLVDKSITKVLLTEKK